MPPPTALKNAASERSTVSDASAKLIAEALRGLEYGSVTFIIQDGLVIQIERTEKKRLARPRRS